MKRERRRILIDDDGDDDDDDDDDEYELKNPKPKKRRKIQMKNSNKKPIKALTLFIECIQREITEIKTSNMRQERGYYGPIDRESYGSRETYRLKGSSKLSPIEKNCKDL